MNLVIIEGAGKVKKISSILGNNFKVIATCGHIERLKDSGYDNTGINHNLEYDFEYIENKSKVMKEINNFGTNADCIYIATDPDREGEGIAYHIFNKLTKNNKEKSKRITFNEISSFAINDAINNPKQLDIDYVNAYLARIALDKKIGYGLSKYLFKNHPNLKSAGRVQSVVLKLICERENEIKNFVETTCWYLAPKISGVELTHISSKNDLGLFTNHNDKKYSFLEKSQAEKYIQDYLVDDYVVTQISNPENKLTYPKSPFKTSSAQQTLIKELKVSSKIVEQILQKLYENGYITYPRTDSSRISNDFCKEAYLFVKKEYPNLASDEFKFNKSKSSSGAQDAHEAIRCVHLYDLGNEIDDPLMKKAYEVIYNQTIIQFMKPLKTEIVEFEFTNNNDVFIAKQERIIERGFTEYLNDNKQDKVLNFELNKCYQSEKDIIKSSTTQPPKPFTQPSLIKELEKLGIGRPSTYASSVEVNNLRKYTSIDKKDILTSTDLGKKAYELVKKNWSDLINFDFTSNMEKSLDLISDGKLNYKEYLKQFLDQFEPKLYSFFETIKNQKQNEIELADYLCPKCNSEVLIKHIQNNKLIHQCKNRIWNPKTKQNEGCEFYEFKEK